MKLNYKTQQTHVYFFILFILKKKISKIKIYTFQNTIFGVHVLQISNLYNRICDDVFTRSPY